MLGHYDAVSGASASVSGMVKYAGSTPVGSPTNYAAEPMGVPFKYRITVSNPGTDISGNYFNCFPLPPGLTINTSPGAAGYITGTPTSVGSHIVTLLAGNLNYPTPATLPVVITIYPPNTAPVISAQPQSVSVLAGRAVSLPVGVYGSLPLNYRWLFNGTNPVGGGSATLSLAGVTLAQAGDYHVVVSNSFGSAISEVARVTVQEPSSLDLRLTQENWTNGSFQFTATGPLLTNYTVWGSVDLSQWLPLQTNFVIDGVLRYNNTEAATRTNRFFRVSFGP